MSLLKALVSSTEISNEKDSLGGSSVLDSGLYAFRIGMAYIKKSDGGALGLFLTLVDADKKEIRQTLWMTSGDAKGNKNYYEKDGQKNYLPGFNQANSLALLTVGKEISELDTEEKVINLYNTDAKAEVPTKVDAVMELIGKEIIAGIVRQTVDKTAKNDAGVYIATGESRDENDIDKLFHAESKMTTAEIRAKATVPAFHDAWGEKNTGVTRNKSKGAAAGGVAGAPKAGGVTGTAKPGKSLFGAA